ncbi:MAG TPA: FAD-dependent monooxygenase [Thermoleophilaceae bacterium]|nr:FAD-dependent monooxygenase [Thermoleophilaceae bacterium]
MLVVGAGPVGLLLACELARRDVPVRLIDKLERPTDQSRAIVVHARSLEMLQQVGVVDRFLEAGVRATAMTMHSSGREVARVELDIVDSPFPFSLALPQTDTEAILTARLEELGTTVDRGTELVSFEQDDDGVRATLADGETVEASYVVGTDGSHSTVRHQMGLGLEGSFKGQTFLIADVEAEYELPRESMHTFFHRDGTFLLFPLLGDRVRIIAEVPTGSPEPTLWEVQAIADARAGEIRLSEAHWLTVFEIHHAQVRSYRRGRAFLAGDAAHVHSPAGGQGMNTGMQDAYNLGWKLALALERHAAPSLLDSYDDERRPVAAQVIRQTTALTRLGTVRRRAPRELRNHSLHLATGLASVRRRMAEQVEETAINYHLSAIVADDGHHHRGTIRAGDVAPEAMMEDGSSLHEVLAQRTGHTYLHVAESPPPFDAVLLPPGGSVADRYGLGAGATVAIRPDGYVGLVASKDGEKALERYKAGVLRD